MFPAGRFPDAVLCYSSGSGLELSLLVPFWILFPARHDLVRLLFPIAVPVPGSSVAVSVLCRRHGGHHPRAQVYTLSLSRALVLFLPFFVIGATYSKTILRTTARSRSRGMPQASRCSAPLSSTFMPGRTSVEGGSTAASVVGTRLRTPDIQGLLIRARLLGVARIATLLFLSLMPNQNGLLAMLGRRSLAVFVLHGFVVPAVTPRLQSVLHEAGGLDSRLDVCLVLTVVIVAVCSRRGVRRVNSPASAPALWIQPPCHSESSPRSLPIIGYQNAAGYAMAISTGLQLN